MGDLSREVIRRIALPQDLEAELKKATEFRNYVTHHFLIDEYKTLMLPSGPDALSKKLRPMKDLFNRLQSELDGYLSKELDRMGNRPHAG